MIQYDHITTRDNWLNDALTRALKYFNYRRNNNNTTKFEDIQIVAAPDGKYDVVIIVSYDDYKSDTAQAPPDRPRFIGQAPIDTKPEGGSIHSDHKPFLEPDHSDE